MEYSSDDLKQKLLDIYPEISNNAINLGLDFDDKRGAWVITFEKGGHNRYAFLDKRDADACLEGTQCIYLGVLIDQYVIDLERELGLHK